jgi:large subunit ribosomal protein L23
VNPHDVILAPVLSEKAIQGIEAGKYAFYVHPDANRVQVKDAIETVFKVEVVKINMAKVRGKIKTQGRYPGRTSLRNKAIVTLQAGQRIQQLEGLT